MRKAPSFSLIKTFVDFSPQNECYGDIKIVLVNAEFIYLSLDLKTLPKLGCQMPYQSCLDSNIQFYVRCACLMVTDHCDQCLGFISRPRTSSQDG